MDLVLTYRHPQEPLLQQAGFRLLPVADRDTTAFRQERFAPYYLALLAQCLQDDQDAITAVQPDRILGDTRLTAAISARVAGRPDAAVVHGWMTDQFSLLAALFPPTHTTGPSRRARTRREGRQASPCTAAVRHLWRAEHGPLPPQWVPRGLPAHHWWWRYPTPDADPTATAGSRRTETDAALLDEVAGVVQGLEHVAFWSPGAEVYHARKHQAEVPDELQHSQDPVLDYAPAAHDTIHTGTVVDAARVQGDSIRVVIHKDYGNDEVMEAIIYVKTNGTVTLATYGARKFKN